MAIRGPKGAVPTVRGWVHPRTGELLKSQKISQTQIDEWHGVSAAPAPKPAPAAVEEVETDMPHDGLDAMTKVELEAIGRQHGVELDRRERKSALVEKVRGLISK